MNKQQDQLDQLLVKLPTHTPPTLAGWHFSADLRQQVQERVAALPLTPVALPEQLQRGDEDNGNSLPGLMAPALVGSSAGGGSRERRRWLRPWQMGLLASLGIIFTFLIWWYRAAGSPLGAGMPGGPPAGFQVKPIQYQWVNLHDPSRAAVVSIGRVEGSDQFLAAISKRREPAGWQLLYTQPLNAYLVLPVKVVQTNANQVALILIAYQEQQEEGYRYLILSFDGEKVIPYNIISKTLLKGSGIPITGSGH